MSPRAITLSDEAALLDYIQQIANAEREGNSQKMEGFVWQIYGYLEGCFKRELSSAPGPIGGKPS